MAVELCAAGALVALELGQLVAAPALLAEALQLALPHELRQADVHIADAVPEVIRAQLAHIPSAIFHLPQQTCRQSLATFPDSNTIPSCLDGKRLASMAHG